MAILPGSGGGSGTVTASDFIEGTSVKMKLLVSTLVGSVLITWWSAFIQFIQNVGEVGRSLATGLIEGQTEIFAAALDVPGGLFDAAYSAAAEFMLVLQPIGPFAFPVAAGITALTLITTSWALRNAEVI